MKTAFERWMASGAWVMALLFVFASPGQAQRRGPSVTAQLSQGVVRLGEQVDLMVVVEGATNATIVDVPRVDGLTIGRPGSPSRETYQSFVNGRSSVVRRVRWAVRIRPQREGDFEIPPIEVEVDGKRAKTRPLSLRAVKDLQGQDLGFVEVKAVPSPVVEGQPFYLEIVFGWDLSVDIAFADLALPWWGELPGALDLGDAPLAAGARVINKNVFVNSRMEVTVEELDPVSRDGRKFRTFRLVKRYLPSRSGGLEFPTSFLEFGQWAKRTSIFSSGREKGKSHFVQAPPFELEVVPLPTEGQPFDYSGAVGSIEARASADTRDVVVGDSIKLTVDWTGDANLEFFEPPDPARLDAFRQFRVYGHTEEKSFERRRVTYDMAPISPEVTEIPPLPLTVFDTERRSYATVETEPIRIRVRPLEGAVSLGAVEEDGIGRDIRDIDTRPLERGASEVFRVPGDAAVVGALVLVPLMWLGARTAVRRRRGDPSAPLERRRRRARRELARALSRADDASAELDAFLEFLAARTREPRAAWTGRQGRLDDAEITELELRPEAVAAIDGALEALERAVYGGGPRPGREAALRSADQALGAGL